MHHVPGRCAPFGRCPWTDVVVHAPRPRCSTSGKGVRFQRSGCRTANGQGVVFGRHIHISARRGAVRVFRVISAATLIMMLLFTTAFAASPSFRAQTLTVLVEMFDDHGEIRFNGITNGAETREMSILWMPDGYQTEFEEFDESRMIIRAEGENGENLNVAATSISKSRSYSFDTEGATEEPATVQGNEATVYQMETEDGDKITVLWTDMEKGWIVRVTGYNISKEDMLRISESVEIR